MLRYSPVAVLVLRSSVLLPASLLAIVLSLGAAPQPAAESGVITGTVANAATRQMLAQAEVRLRGTYLSTITDQDGFFRLSGAPVGRHSIEAVYTGLDSQVHAVEVRSGGTTMVVFELTSSIYTMEQFVVAGEREGQAAALNQTKNADHMKSVVASDAFGDLMGNRAAELLASLPGFAMDFSGEEAVGFTWRGQESRYASVTVDGNAMASGANNGNTRLVNFRNVLVNNIDAIEINRAPTAAQPANAMAGSINFVSKSAFSQKGRRLRLDLGANINTDSVTLGKSYQGLDGDRHTLFPTLKIDYSDTFRTDTDHPIGLVVNATATNNYGYSTILLPSYSYVPALRAGESVTPETPAIANGATFQEASGGSMQRSISVNLDYKLSEASTLFVRGLYQTGPQRTIYGLNHTLQFFGANQSTGSGVNAAPINGNSANFIDSRPNASPVAPGANSGSRIMKESGYEMSDNQLYQFTVGARHRFGSLSLDYNAFYSRAFDQRDPAGAPYTGGITYVVTNVGYVMENVQSPDRVSVRQTAGPDYTKLGNYQRLTWTTDNRFSLDARYGAKIDARRVFSPRGFLVTLQAGGAYNFQDRKTSGTSSGSQTWFGAGPDGVFGNADDMRLPLEQFIDTRLPREGWNMRGFSSIAPGEWLDASKLFAYVKQNPGAATVNLVQEVNAAHGARAMIFEEEIPALYGMATVRFGRLQVMPGIRWEQTRDRGQGFSRSTVATPAGLTMAQQAEFVARQYSPVARKVSYDGFYPNLQGRYNITDNLIARASYNETIGRTDLPNLLPGSTVAVANRTITRNNPELKPFSAKNYDLSLEYYFSKFAGSLNAAVFRKEVENAFSTFSFILPGGADNGYDGNYEGYTVSESRNIPGVTESDGFEIGYSQALRFLPGLLRNLSANATYSRVDSVPVPGQSRLTGIYPEVFNAGLSYNDSRLRLDLKYNFRAQWMQSVNAANGEEIFNRDNDRLDVAFAFRFYKRYTFYLNWRNIWNELQYRTVEGNRLNNWRQSGVSINTGVRADF